MADINVNETFQTPNCGYRLPLPDGKVACEYHTECPHRYDNYDQRFGIGYWRACRFELGMVTEKQAKEQQKQMDINFSETGSCGTFPDVNYSGQYLPVVSPKEARMSGITIEELDLKIQKQRDLIKDMESHPVSDYVDAASRGESIFRASLREHDLLSLKSEMIIEGLRQ